MNMDRVPEISVIVPVYKGVRFLREALGSVRAQTFADWECLCVDDGSKDGSGALLDELTADEPRFRVFHRENGGTSVARNFALSQARGRYIAFLDEDDVYHPLLLEVLRAAAKKTGADVVGCEFKKFAEGAKPVFGGDVPDETKWRRADRAGIREWICDYYDGVPFEIWRNLYRREVVAGHAFRDGVRVEQDLLWHYTLLPRVANYVRLPWTGYGWRMNAAGGYLNPDAESLISLTASSLEVLETMSRKMGLSPDQLLRFRRAMTLDVKYHVWESLRRGLPLDSAQARRLRDGCRKLRRQGVDVTAELRGCRKLQWLWFLLTGRWRGRSDVARGLRQVKYGYVCSIGHYCATAMYLQRHFLRDCSSPLDWVGMGPNGLSTSIGLIGSHFRGFLSVDNLPPLVNRRIAGSDDLAHDYYLDTATQMMVIHDFPAGVPLKESYPAVRDKYDRRIGRMLGRLRTTEHSLLVYQTKIERLEDETIVACAQQLRNHFGGRGVDLLVIEHVEGSAGVSVTTPATGVWHFRGPFFRQDIHPVLGDIALCNGVYSQIRCRGKSWRVMAEKARGLFARVLSLPHFSREGRKAARERWKARLTRQRGGRS